LESCFQRCAFIVAAEQLHAQASCSLQPSHASSEADLILMLAISGTKQGFIMGIPAPDLFSIAVQRDKRLVIMIVDDSLGAKPPKIVKI
jgi:hypothetical protein